MSKNMVFEPKSNISRCGRQFLVHHECSSEPLGPRPPRSTTVSDTDRKLIKLDISLIYVVILWPNDWLVC